MGSCNVCGSTNVDIIKGVCGNCIGKRTAKLRRKRNMIKIITIVIICAIVISGLEYLSASGILQSLTQQASKTIPQTTSEIAKKIVPQTSQQATTSNTMTSTNEDTRVPIRVYDNCNSLVRADNMKDITTYCNSVAPSFRFNMPDILQQALQGQELLSVKTTVYQYGTNDFKIGLYDQLGEKNYTVTLWQFPQ